MSKRLIVVGLLVIGCSSATGIRPRLPAAVTVTYTDAVGDSTVEVKSDSVVTVATLNSTCGGTYSVAAAMFGGEVRVVVTDSLPELVPCALSFRYRTIRAAVAGVPSGTRPVELDLRSVVASNKQSSVVLRGVVSVP